MSEYDRMSSSASGWSVFPVAGAWHWLAFAGASTEQGEALTKAEAEATAQRVLHNLRYLEEDRRSARRVFT